MLNAAAAALAVHGLKNAMDRMVKPAWKELGYRWFSGDGWLAVEIPYADGRQPGR